MNILSVILLIGGAYLLGSIPHLVLLARLKKVQVTGDLHSALWYRVGKPFAIIGILGEFARGILPVITGKLLDFDLAVVSAAGLAVVCGQMWPIFARFDGEKGNTIGLAMATALTTWAMAIAIIPLAIGAGIRTFARLFPRGKNGKHQPVFGGPTSNSLPLAMFLTFLVLPFACWILNQPIPLVIASALLFVVIMIRRLTDGLQADLQTGVPGHKIFLMRLFLDRPAVDMLPDQNLRSAE
ncbi:MAG: glycerol-3-phosphate acyltransferase [Dehalococcoidales bacterium]|jgi:glycerol-3-phosphate acyltransferase PlsY|nr:glycerol-3-phosphate acyltransferase [Dehalococcoidales bacterium]